MTVDHLKMLQATGGKGKELTVCLLIFGEIFANSRLTSCDRQLQIKGVEINANGRIELVGKNYWDKRSTWPWACVCFHNTVGVKASFTGSPVRDLFGVSKEHWNVHRETKQIHKHPNINRRFVATIVSHKTNVKTHYTAAYTKGSGTRETFIIVYIFSLFWNRLFEMQG